MNAGHRVLELLTGIDLQQPRVDREEAAHRLQAYVRALGLPTPKVRWVGDLRALREGRVYRRDRSGWPSFLGRQWWLLDERWPRTVHDAQSGLDQPEPSSEHGFPRVTAIARADRVVLDVGLGISREVQGVRRVIPSLHLRAWQLTTGVAPLAPSTRSNSGDQPPDVM